MSVTPNTGPPAQKLPASYEFTKRKRWADLLITELADAIILILSPTCQILFCGAAVTELLGWRDDELIDTDMLCLVGGGDRANFRASFEESIRTNTELLSYTPLMRKNLLFAGFEQVHAQGASNVPGLSDSTEVLFEIKGYPHYVPDPDLNRCKCFFAIAKPYPSRSTSMLNTFLELKMENERLQQRLVELRGQGPSSPQYAVPPQALPASSHRHSEPYYSSGLAQSGYDILPSTSRSILDPPSYAGGLLYGTAPSPSLANEEEGSRKKKFKKAPASDQYVCVTCGRTDSPEWRKGPQGPKSLCNACGLRWAKQMRKFDEPQDAGGPGDG